MICVRACAHVCVCVCVRVCRSRFYSLCSLSDPIDFVECSFICWLYLVVKLFGFGFVSVHRAHRYWLNVLRILDLTNSVSPEYVMMTLVPCRILGPYDSHTKMIMCIMFVCRFLFLLCVPPSLPCLHTEYMWYVCIHMPALSTSAQSCASSRKLSFRCEASSSFYMSMKQKTGSGVSQLVVNSRAWKYVDAHGADHKTQNKTKNTKISSARERVVIKWYFSEEKKCF